WRDPESGRGGLSEAMVRFALRAEMARRIDDVLARRSRLLFLDAAAAAALAEPVAALIEQETGRSVDAAERAEFAALALHYRTLP
ncbi:MAG: FAD-dependent oxidoreductase, partial [Rubrivivax sp.]|nr:FAD-dependent oxidoreductase [Rubrivivax sp.]